MPERTDSMTANFDKNELKKEARKSRAKAFQEGWYRFSQNKATLVSMIVIILLVLIAIFAPVLTPYSYDAIDPLNANLGPSLAHPFGTDAIGRDLMTRIFYGARYSLLIAFAAQGVGIVGGIFLGALAGYFEGLLSDIIMRICDILQAIPATLLAIVVSQTLGSGFISTTLALAVTTVPSVGRVVRALILQIRNQEYIEAGRAIDCSDARIIFRHILPNIIPQVIISFTSGLSGKIIESASLSYLGLGIQPPTPEWGALLTDGKAYLRYYPHLVIAPGVFIMIAALAFNLVGDGLRDALDPKLRD
ncbi:MAG: ABC transporter permease [Lachnospiraceae bacterium]|nr:ABC transporter permease [Lachnospiraceae bacterium]